MIVGIGNQHSVENRTMETTIKEYSLNDSNLVELVRNEEHSDYVVRYLVDRKFGHKVFTSLKKAEKFYSQLQSTIVENSILEKIIS
jgi:hypothetical protein